MSQRSETPPRPGDSENDVLTVALVKESRDRRENDEIDAGLTTPELIEDFALKDDYALNPQYISLVIDAADRGDGMRLRELLEPTHDVTLDDELDFGPFVAVRR